MYHIKHRNDASAIYLSPGLDDPQSSDITAARAGLCVPGGDIFLHGQPNALPNDVTRRRDSTAGGVALSDTEIEDPWRAAALGTPVEIRP